MRCLADEILSAVADGEASREEMAHVATCSACREVVEELRGLDEALRALPLAAEPAPKTLHATLRGIRAHGARQLRILPKVAAGGLTAVLVAATLLISPETGTVEQALAEQAISRHLQAFATGDGSGCQVESQDPHALASWLGDAVGGRVDVPAPFQDARLVGGRRCQLFGEATAAAVYRTEEAPVTVFFPQPGTAAYEACERTMGSCREGRDGQTVCVLPGEGGAPMVVVGALPADKLCEVVESQA